MVDSLFWYVCSFDLVLFPDGMSFLALLYFHFHNYRPARRKRTLTQASNSPATVDINESGAPITVEVDDGNAKIDITNSESDYVYLPKSKDSPSSI